MRRIGLIVAMLAVVLPAAAAGQTSQRQGAGPAYLTAMDAQFSLNTSWHGAHQVTAAPKSELFDSKAETGQAIWAPTCGAARQTVVFTRTVELLGPPRSAELMWSFFAAGGATPSWQGLQSLDLSVNDHLVYHWTEKDPQNDFTFPAKTLRDFRVGKNDLEIRATRQGLPAGVTRCNVPGTKPFVALEGRFDLSFATDLRVGVPKEPLYVGLATSVTIQQFVKNMGPDVALDGELYVYYGGSNSEWKVLGGAGDLKGLKNTGQFCEKEREDSPIAHCRFGKLAPGQTYTILMRIAYTPPADYPDWDHYGMAASFAARSATPDSNGANDSTQVNFILCQKASTLPQCQSLGAGTGITVTDR